MMKIERAQKKKQKLKIALAGISGSGKTYSALTLAFSMCEKVIVIDTECGSASLYSDHFPQYDVLELSAPYSPQRYIEAIKMAESAGYECIIIDSLSHEWNGPGGCLEMVNSISKTGGNSYTAWGKVTPHHDALIAHMIASQSHIIVTMRAKTAYEITTNDKGKQAPVKVGMAPTQRDGVEYEFTIVFDIDQNHNFTCSKDRTSLFNNVDIPQPLNKEIGQKILEWLDSGVEFVNPLAANPEKPAGVWGDGAEAMKKIRASFIEEAKVLKERFLGADADEGCDRNAFLDVIEALRHDWYSLCNRYMISNDWFVVRQDIAEKMHELLGLKKPVAIKQGVIDFGMGEIVSMDVLLNSVKKAVNE
jgi:hypothetical protein